MHMLEQKFSNMKLPTIKIRPLEGFEFLRWSAARLVLRRQDYKLHKSIVMAAKFFPGGLQLQGIAAFFNAMF